MTTQIFTPKHPDQPQRGREGNLSFQHRDRTKAACLKHPQHVRYCQSCRQAEHEPRVRALLAAGGHVYLGPTDPTWTSWPTLEDSGRKAPPTSIRYECAQCGRIHKQRLHHLLADGPSPECLTRKGSRKSEGSIIAIGLAELLLGEEAIREWTPEWLRRSDGGSGGQMAFDGAWPSRRVVLEYNDHTLRHHLVSQEQHLQVLQRDRRKREAAEANGYRVITLPLVEDWRELPKLVGSALKAAGQRLIRGPEALSLADVISTRTTEARVRPYIRMLQAKGYEAVLHSPYWYGDQTVLKVTCKCRATHEVRAEEARRFRCRHAGANHQAQLAGQYERISREAQRQGLRLLTRLEHFRGSKQRVMLKCSDPDHAAFPRFASIITRTPGCPRCLRETPARDKARAMAQALVEGMSLRQVGERWPTAKGTPQTVQNALSYLERWSTRDPEVASRMAAYRDRLAVEAQARNVRLTQALEILKTGTSQKDAARRAGVDPTSFGDWLMAIGWS